MDQRDLVKRLNSVINRAGSGWSDLGLWPGNRRESQTHRALSGILAVIGEAEPVWASATTDFGAENDFETASFDVTVWTDKLALRAERSPGQEWPSVTVAPRKTLRGLRILESPNLTELFSSADRRLTLELTYEAFTVTTSDAYDALLELLPTFARDLEA